MLIVPVSGQPDWRRPPLILLLLILINVLVFFGAQGRETLDRCRLDEHPACRRWSFVGLR